MPTHEESLEAAEVLLMDEDATKGPEASPKRYGRCSRWAVGWCALGVAAIILSAALAGVRRRNHRSPSTEPAEPTVVRVHETTEAAAERMMYANFSEDPCESPWDWACGSYSDATGHTSVLVHLQTKVDAALSKVLTEGPTGSPPADFYRQCLNGTPTEAHHMFQNTTAAWMWTHGIQAGTVDIGRVQRATSHERILAIQIESTRSACEIVPVTFCDNTLPTPLRTIMGGTAADTEVCIMRPPRLTVGPNGTVCDLLASTWASTQLHKDILYLPGNAAWCMQQIKDIWPTSLSTMWLQATPAKDRQGTKDIFDAAKGIIVDTLRTQRHTTLASLVEDNVQLHTEHKGQFDAVTQVLDPTDFLESWLHARATAHALDMSRMFALEGEWLMGAYEMNAYYLHADNGVYITPAISSELGRKSQVGLWGQLGFVIAHEVAHAIHSFAEDLELPQGEAAAYAAGKLCLTLEFHANGTTVHEDYADRVAAASLGGIRKTLAKHTKAISETYSWGTHRITLGANPLVFLAAAQTWCAADPNAHSADDPHSPKRARVDHSLRSSADFRAALNCPPLPQSWLCSVPGAF